VPEKAIPLPWDKKHKAEAPQISKEEAKKRFERLVKKI
jgi:hypothetical protein